MSSPTDCADQNPTHALKSIQLLTIASLIKFMLVQMICNRFQLIFDQNVLNLSRIY